MITESDQRTAEELRARLLAHRKGRVRQIILYGSRARGTASPESDFDVLVIEADPVFKWDEMRRLRQVVHDLPHGPRVERIENEADDRAGRQPVVQGVAENGFQRRALLGR